MTNTAELTPRKKEIFNELRPLLASSLSVSLEEVELEKTLSDLHADSLDSVQTIMDVEKHYNLAIPDADMEKFTNIRSIVDYIEAHTSAPETTV